MQKTILFVGAGRHQRRAILRAKELGLRVVGIDRNPDALGLEAADIAKVVDFSDPSAVLKAVGRPMTCFVETTLHLVLLVRGQGLG